MTTVPAPSPCGKSWRFAFFGMTPAAVRRAYLIANDSRLWMPTPAGRWAPGATRSLVYTVSGTFAVATPAQTATLIAVLRRLVGGAE